MKTLFVCLTLRCLCVVLAAASPAAAEAHDGPEHEVDEITAEIKKHGESEELLVQRAIEYRLIGKNDEAVADLKKALKLKPLSVPAHRELSRAYSAMGKGEEAFKVVNRGLAGAKPGVDRSTMLVLRAEMYRVANEPRKALEDVELAIKGWSGNVDWYLLRSDLQGLLKLHVERLTGLQEGVRDTGSGLLDAELVDAYLDAGRFAEAFAKIDAELKSTRLRSTWLIRRARVFLASSKTKEARDDLAAAVTELTKRINPKAPDPTLLADRGLANELLGDFEAAKADFETARAKGHSDEWVAERLRALKGKRK